MGSISIGSPLDVPNCEVHEISVAKNNKKCLEDTTKRWCVDGEYK